jgi:hypothetical protein
MQYVLSVPLVTTLRSQAQLYARHALPGNSKALPETRHVLPVALVHTLCTSVKVHACYVSQGNTKAKSLICCVRAVLLTQARQVLLVYVMQDTPKRA